MNLPEKYVKNMKELLGEEEFDSYLESFNDSRLYGLRVNTQKISTEEFEKICPFNIRKIPWIDNGYYFSEEDKPAKHPYYFAGLYYIQEPSAMTPANMLPVNEGDKVFDMCAAPGGKSTELGAKLKGTGLLVTNDISNSRAKALLKNVEVFGLRNTLVINEDPRNLVDKYRGFFDKILVDAPCSGEGMFRKDSKLIKAWEKNGPEVYNAIQKDIILYAADMLKPGGMMMYSTCTFSKLEDELTIKYLLEQRPEMSVVRPEFYEGFTEGFDGLSDCVRIFPHKMEGEGHFMALLKKEDGSEPKYYPDFKGNMKKIPPELEEFLNDISIKIDRDELYLNDGRVFLIPKEASFITGIRALRTGLLLGELKKNRFEPSQALAMALKAEEYASVVDLSVDDENVIRYLKGETIEIDDSRVARKSGWQLVCVDGFPLGFGKLSNGTLKNKYLAGWRWQ